MSEDRDTKRRGIFGAEDPDANPLVILASYAMLVLLIGAAAGGFCLLVPYVYTMSSSNSHQTRYERREQEQQEKWLMEHDTVRASKWRFWGGAAAGAGLTVVALVVMNARKRA